MQDEIFLPSILLTQYALCLCYRLYLYFCPHSYPSSLMPQNISHDPHTQYPSCSNMDQHQNGFRQMFASKSPTPCCYNWRQYLNRLVQIRTRKATYTVYRLFPYILLIFHSMAQIWSRLDFEIPRSRRILVTIK
jgi:hypothetical protein